MLDFFDRLLFDLSFTGNDYGDLFIQILAMLALWAALLYVLYFAITKFTAGGKAHVDYKLQINFLWALAVFQLLFVIYLFYLIRYRGMGIFQWGHTDFYLGAAPQLIIFVGTILLFINSYTAYRRALPANP